MATTSGWLASWWYGSAAASATTTSPIPPTLLAEMRGTIAERRLDDYAEGRADAHQLIECLRRRVALVRLSHSPTQRRRLLGEVFDLCATHAAIIRENPRFCAQLREKMIKYTRERHVDLRPQYARLFGEPMPPLFT